MVKIWGAGGGVFSCGPPLRNTLCVNFFACYTCHLPTWSGCLFLQPLPALCSSASFRSQLGNTKKTLIFWWHTQDSRQYFILYNFVVCSSINFMSCVPSNMRKVTFLMTVYYCEQWIQHNILLFSYLGNYWNVITLIFDYLFPQGGFLKAIVQ